MQHYSYRSLREYSNYNQVPSTLMTHPPNWHAPYVTNLVHCTSFYRVHACTCKMQELMSTNHNLLVHVTVLDAHTPSSGASSAVFSESSLWASLILSLSSLFSRHTSSSRCCREAHSSDSTALPSRSSVSLLCVCVCVRG